MAERMTGERCKGLLAAFERWSSVPSEDRRGRPLTPNDPATIAVLATEVLRCWVEIEKLKEENGILAKKLHYLGG